MTCSGHAQFDRTCSGPSSPPPARSAVRHPPQSGARRGATTPVLRRSSRGSTQRGGNSISARPRIGTRRAGAPPRASPYLVALTWERDRDAVASADFRADTAGLILCYDGDGTEAPKVIEQRVALSFVPATFSGARAYFLCPGAECGRRVSVLYFRRGVFRCRHRHGLAYESQREDAVHRARRRAGKLRARLGWPQQRAFALPIVVKPKGMWSSTFERLRGYAIAAESVATAVQLAHWTRLLGRVNRRQRRAEPA
jgi:hypothetical protein